MARRVEWCLPVAAWLRSALAVWAASAVLSCAVQAQDNPVLSNSDAGAYWDGGTDIDQSPAVAWPEFTSVENIEVTSLRLQDFVPETVRATQVATAPVEILVQVWVSDWASPNVAERPIGRAELAAMIRKAIGPLELFNPLTGGVLQGNLRIFGLEAVEALDANTVVVSMTAEANFYGSNFDFYSVLFGTDMSVGLRLPEGVHSNAVMVVPQPLSDRTMSLIYGTGIFAAFLLFLTYVLNWLRERRTIGLDFEGVEVELRNTKEKLNSAEARYSAIEEERRAVDGWVQRARESEGLDGPADPLPPVPDRLIDQLVKGSAILTLGMGVSTMAGVPTWRRTIVTLSQWFDSDLTPGMRSSIAGALERTSGDFTATQASVMLEAIIAQFDRSRVSDVIKRLLDDVDPDLSFHRHALRLPWRGVVSLTWDDLIVQAARMDGDVFLDAIAPKDGEALQSSIRAGHRFVVQGLGGRDDWALTLGEFNDQLALNPVFARQMAVLLDNSGFLFMGIRPQSLIEYLQAFGDSVEEGSARHFALVPFTPDNALYEITLRRYGVEMLEYDPAATADPFGAFMHSVREAWQARVEAGEVPAPDGLDAEIAARRVEWLRLENIGPFKELVLDLSEGRNEGADGRWTVILGHNGAGKSIILRSIGLALMGTGDQAESVARSLLRNGADRGTIQITLGTQTLVVELYRDREAVRLTKGTRSTPVEAGQMLVIGFPALRGAPVPDPTGVLPLEIRSAQPLDIAPLVLNDIDPRMSEFKQWILNVLNDAKLGRPEAARIRALLDEIVTYFLPGGFIGFADLQPGNVICLRADDGTLVPFGSVSQGMSSIFNWTGVLVQRLYDVYPDSKAAHREHAIVLIDEIDVHLHPDWQRRLVELIKRFFPNVQVLATTHSPLIASSLEAHELRVLGRDGRLKRPEFDTYGRSSDEIMQSDIGGLRNARPFEVERKIVEFKDLVGMADRGAQDTARMAELRKELSELGWIDDAEEEGFDMPSDEEVQNFMAKYRA